VARPQRRRARPPSERADARHTHWRGSDARQRGL